MNDPIIAQVEASIRQAIALIPEALRPDVARLIDAAQTLGAMKCVLAASQVRDSLGTLSPAN